MQDEVKQLVLTELSPKWQIILPLYEVHFKSEKHLSVYYLRTIPFDCLINTLVQMWRIPNENASIGRKSEHSEWEKTLIYMCHVSRVMIRWQQDLHHLFSPEPVGTEAWTGLGRQRCTAYSSQKLYRNNWVSFNHILLLQYITVQIKYDELLLENTQLLCDKGQRVTVMQLVISKTDYYFCFHFSEFNFT